MGRVLVEAVLSSSRGTPTQRHVLTIIAFRAKDATGITWVKRRRLEQDTGLGDKAVRRAITALKELGELVEEPDPDHGRAFRVTLTAVPKTGSADPGLRSLRPRAAVPKTAAPVAKTAASEAAPLTTTERSSEPGSELALPGVNDVMAGAVVAVRKRDEVWDALMLVCGVRDVTGSARGAYNRAAKDLREVGATPQEIGARAMVYRERWPDVSLTPTALARRWGECDPGMQHRRAPSRRETDQQAVLAEAVRRAEAKDREEQR